MKEFIPGVGDTQAREAWDQVFSRDILGSVILGGATGKFVENGISLLVLYYLGPSAPVILETLGRLIAWSFAIPVGIMVFVYWHRIEDTTSETLDEFSD